jgi:hypothetical protein
VRFFKKEQNKQTGSHHVLSWYSLSLKRQENEGK